MTQLVAFHAENQPATKEMLQPVECHDISLGGISFFMSSSPPSEYCTVILGRPPALIFVRARVTHSEKENELRRWKIGCKFIDKVDSLVAQG